MKTYILIVLIFALIRSTSALKQTKDTPIANQVAAIVLVLTLAIAIILMSYMPE